MRLKFITTLFFVVIFVMCTKAQTPKAIQNAGNSRISLPKFSSVSGEIEIVNDALSNCRDLAFNKSISANEMLKYTQIEVHKAVYKKAPKGDPNTGEHFGEMSGYVPGELIYSNLIMGEVNGNHLPFSIVGFDESSHVMLVCKLKSQMFNKEYTYTFDPLSVTSADKLKSKPVVFKIICTVIN